MALHALVLKPPVASFCGLLRLFSLITIPFLADNQRMRVAKPLLLIATPIGVAYGLYEGWRLAGGLVFIMAAMLAVIGFAIGSAVMTIRKEKEGECERSERKK